MNNLIATWHRSRWDLVEHLSEAHCQLLDVPGLEAALAMVDAALTEVCLWLDQPVRLEKARPVVPTT